MSSPSVRSFGSVLSSVPGWVIPGRFVAGWLVFSWMVLFGMGCGVSETAPATKPLNLLVILVDTLRADHLGYAGHSHETTPRVDALAGESVTFGRHYSHASRTSPSVASLITGLHPVSHGVVNPLSRYDQAGTLTDSQTTLAEILREKGYRTAGFVGNLNVSDRFGFSQGFDTYQYVKHARAAMINAAGLRWIAKAGAPFFLYLHYMEPHSSYSAPKAYRSMFVDPDYDGPVTGDHWELVRAIAGKWDPSADDVAEMSGLYDQEIRYFDDQLKKLLAALEQLGRLEDTVIVLASDHGEEFLDHGSLFHGYTLYEEQLRVPFMIRDPRRTEPRRIDAVTRHVDVLPTLLELLGVAPPPALQGRSLVPLMDGREPGEVEVPVVAHASLRATKTVRLRSLRLGPWKWIETEIPEPGEQLFHLEKDPGEITNLVAIEVERASSMRERLASILESQPVGEQGGVELRPDEIEALRSLGYLE